MKKSSIYTKSKAYKERTVIRINTSGRFESGIFTDLKISNLKNMTALESVLEMGIP